MSISYPPIANQQIASVNTSNRLVTTSSAEIVPANPNRAAGAMLINNTNKALWIRLGDNTSPATTITPGSFSIPASGGNYLLPAQYQGPIQGILAATATGNVQFIEPNY